MEKIDYNFEELQKTIDKHAIAIHALRGRYFDDEVKEYLIQYPEGVIVNIGTGTVRAFGGRVHYFGITFLDNRNIDIIKQWATEIGKKFK